MTLMNSDQSIPMKSEGHVWHNALLYVMVSIYFQVENLVLKENFIFQIVIVFYILLVSLFVGIKNHKNEKKSKNSKENNLVVHFYKGKTITEKVLSDNHLENEDHTHVEDI